MKLSRQEIFDIIRVVNTHLDVEEFTIIKSHEGGIGPSLSIKFETEVKGQRGEFEIDLTDVAKW